MNKKEEKKKGIITLFLELSTALKSLVIAGVVLFFMVNGYVFYKSIISNSSDKTDISGTLIGNYVKKSKDIVSYKYFYTNAAMFENKKNIYGINLPLTSKRFIISYNGKATLGVDLSNVETEVIGNKIIISKIGKATIISNEFDEKSIKIFDESTSLFSSWNIKDYQKFFADQRSEIEKKILESDLLKEARISAEDTIKQLLMLNPQVSSKYEIEFKD